MNDIREKLTKLKSEKDLLELINELAKEEMGENIHPLTYQQLSFYANTNSVPTEKRYHTFEIPKKRKGEFRKISSPVQQLKTIQYFIKIMLEGLYEPKDCVMGFVKNRSIVDNARRHINQFFILNLDIEDFFPSISQDRIVKCLCHAPYNIQYNVAFMIARLCCIRRTDESIVLPQGSPTSPIIANMVCSQLDESIMSLAKQFGLVYTRYADDMTFSGQYNSFKEKSSFMKCLSSNIEKNGFKLNLNKKRIQKHGSRQEVTGIIVSTKTNVRRKYIKEIRVVLHNWETLGYAKANKCFIKYYQHEGKKNHPAVPDMRNVIDGKLEYLKMVKGLDDMTYLRLKERFDRLVSQFNSTVLKIWTWSDFEKEKGVKLIIQISPISMEKYVDIPGKDNTQRYFFPHSLDVSNLDHLQIEMFQREDATFYSVSEIEREKPLFKLLGIQ